MAKTSKRKRSIHLVDERQQQQNLAIDSRQSTGRDGVPRSSKRCESVEAAGYLIKRPLQDGKKNEDSRRVPYMRLAKVSCVRIEDFARQSYRMTTEHFWCLHDLLAPFLGAEPLPAPEHKEDWNQPLRIKAALRFFAGGDPLEIAADHSIPTLWLLEEYVYDVIEAIHECNDLAIAYPDSHDEQREIAAGFALFRCDDDIVDCCGALGGMLLPIEPPTYADANERELMFNARAGMWGLNLQGVCDYNGRFLEVCLNSPASASDKQAFMDSSFRHKLERPDFLADGLSLYAHQYYPDRAIITKPPQHLNEKDMQDAEELNHFQLRDQIDTAFSCLLQRWALLRRPLPLSLGEAKIKQLVLAVCKLQNFCLEDTELMPPLLAGDVVFGILNGAVLLDKHFRPARILGAGKYLDGTDGRDERLRSVCE